MKIMVVSSKGGVGNSTIAMQLITPYLYIKNGYKPIDYYELDDENSDYLSFGDSQLSYRHVVKVNNPLLEQKVTEMFSSDNSTCIDIGSNTTTTTVLDALEASGMIPFVDLVVIPLLDGEQDGINAIMHYINLKGSYPKTKFLFVLNRCESMEELAFQYENFFGDFRGMFKSQYTVQNNLYEEDKENYIAMLHDHVIKNSRRFGLGIYEVATQKNDFSRELAACMADDKQSKKLQLLSFKNSVHKRAVYYLKTVLEPAFEKIDKIIGENSD